MNARAKASKLTPADREACDRLRSFWDVRDRSAVTQEVVADLMGGISQGAVSQYLTYRTRLNFRAVTAFAKALGIDPTTIRSDLPEQKLVDSGRTGDEWSDVLGYAQAVALGDGRDPEEYAETHKLKFRAESLKRKHLRPHTLAVVYGRGDSMLPRIHQGDAILFDTSDTIPKDDKLFIVHSAGPRGIEYSAKRCRDFDGLIFFDSLNPDGDHGWKKPRRMDDPKRPISIVGRVRWIGSWED